MSDTEKKQDGLDFFEQMDEALEERKGTDRRKQVPSDSLSGEDRRKGDRRKDNLADS